MFIDANKLIETSSGAGSEDVRTVSKSESWLFFWLGNVSLLVFNIAINAIDIYAIITNDKNIGNDLNRAYNIPSSIAALILCFVTIRNHKRSFIISITSLLIIVSVMAASMIIKMPAKIVYYISVVSIGLSGVFSAIILSSSFALATQFAPESSTSVSSGNGLCGVLAAALRITTKAVFSSESSLKYSSFCYFILTAIIILATLIYFIKKVNQPSISSKFIFPAETVDIKSFLRSLKGTFKHISLLWIGCVLDFMITLTIFPGYVCAGPEGALKSWNPVCITTFFCIFDWLGRWLPSKFLWPSLNLTIFPILLRLLFFPIEIISLQKVLNLGEPWFTLFMQIPFAITNGYFGTTVMIYASIHPKLTDEQKKTAGFMMSFAINFGIIIAMFLTYAMPIPKA